MKKLLGLLTLLLSMQVYAGTTENQVLDEAPESVELESGINLFNAQKAETLSDIALANVEALADDEVNPLCPNGCVENGTGCFCNGWYPSYQEAGKNGNL